MLYWKKGDPTPWEEILRLNAEGRNIAEIPLPMNRPKRLSGNSKYGWRGGVASGHFRDLILDFDFPQKMAEPPSWDDVEGLYAMVASQLPLELRKGIFRAYNTGGGLQLRIRLASCLSEEQYRKFIPIVQAALANVSCLDPTSFSHNQPQRMPGTRNWKYVGGPTCREITWRPPGLPTFRPIAYNGLMDSMKAVKLPTRGVKKAIQLALDFARGVYVGAVGMAEMALKWLHRRLSLNWSLIEQSVDPRAESLLRSVCGEAPFTMAEIAGFDRFRFMKALRSAIVQNFSVKQLKSLRGIPSIVKNIEKGMGTTSYPNDREHGDRARELTVGYKLAKIIHGHIQSLAVKKKKRRGFTNSFDVIDLVLAGWIQEGKISRTEKYESAWQRVVLYLAELAGWVEVEKEKNDLWEELETGSFQSGLDPSVDDNEKIVKEKITQIELWGGIECHSTS